MYCLYRSWRRVISSTLVTTPVNVTNLRSSILADSPIHFAEVPFSGSDHGLPSDSGSNDTVPVPYMRTLVFATETLQAPFERLVSGIMEDGWRHPLIVFDYLLGWTVETARKLKVPHAAFFTIRRFWDDGHHGIVGSLSPPQRRFRHLQLAGFPESVQLHRSQLPPSCGRSGHQRAAASRSRSGGVGAGDAGHDLAASAGDTVPPVDGGVPGPPRVELGGGEPPPRRADHGLAGGRRAGLQVDGGGGVAWARGGVRGRVESALGGGEKGL